MTGKRDVRVARPSLGRFLAVFVVAVVGLILIAWVLPAFSVDDWRSGALAILVLGVVNCLILLLTAEPVDGIDVPGILFLQIDGRQDW